MENKCIITPEHSRITVEQMISELKLYMQTRPDSKIIVGSDSQKVKKGFSFATAIAAIDPGNGGIFYIKKEYRKPERVLKNVKSVIAWKVYQEAEDTRNMMQILTDEGIEMTEKITHHDLSLLGLSGEHIPSIAGWMTSLGFKPEFKPQSFIASGIANKYSKN